MQFQSIYVALALAAVSSKVYFEEQFNELGDRWVFPDGNENHGKVEISSGKFHCDEEKSKGLQTMGDARFYALSSKLDKEFDNKGKDLVVQFSVKHEQDIDCGGGYIKLLPKMDPKKFNGDSKYNLMFGPDICGSDRKVHAILNYKEDNKLTKRYINVPNDLLTHFYTWIIRADKTYEILVDNEQKVNGTLVEDWDLLAPSEIDDPEDKKPGDWVEEEFIPDPDEKKPADWVDGPATIIDPEAVKPDDWNEEDDGEWEAPTIANPDFKGEWSAKDIKNPAYKGEWEPKKISNPDYKEDKTVGEYVSNHVGFDLWQVKSGTIFDNILVTDDVEYAKDYAEKFITACKEPEEKAKELLDKQVEEEEKKKEEEEEAKRKAEEAAEKDTEKDTEDKEEEVDLEVEEDKDEL